jgi:2-polyprenyl-6-hydroxyphenyl methylase/3-demethylubiquinone-9 3-methyltransferase
MTEGYQDYGYHSAGLGCSHDYLLPKVFEILEARRNGGSQSRIFELGCGNGSVANALHQRGFEVQGIDYSESGIQVAREHYPHLKLDVGSAYDDLAGKYGKFPLLLSLEVVEHLFFPRKFAKAAFDLLEDGGTAVISTPYHGYWKNLALALSGKMDAHFTALWDGGHIKFWSAETMTTLLTEAGFRDMKFYRAGRIPALAKSMIVVARKPTQ